MSSGPILVTGAAGFVGRHVLARAAKRGIDAVASEGDLRDAGATRALVERTRPAAVIHLASRPRSETALNDEVAMARNVVAAAGDAVALVAGSAAQYGMASQEPVQEDAPTEPVSRYGEIKCAVERAALAGGTRVIAARTFNIVGPGQGVDAPIPSWAAQLANGADSLRTGNLDVVRDFLDVRDTADVLLDLVASDFRGVVNVGSGVPVTLRSVVDELIGISGRDVAVEFDPALARAEDPPRVVADVTRLRSAISFAPRTTLHASLSDVFAEWRERAQAGAR